jgi:uncharacterized OB-fold protein
MRGIRRATAVAPVYSDHELTVPGPDEDTFTLAAATIEDLAFEGIGEVPELHLVGEYPAVAEWGFAALVGRPALPLVRYPSSGVGLLSALAAASAGSGDRSAVVVAAETPFSGSGIPLESASAGAVAFQLEEGEGVAVPLTESEPPVASAEEAFATTAGVPTWHRSSLLRTARQLETVVGRLSSGDRESLSASEGDRHVHVALEHQGSSQWLGDFRASARVSRPFDHAKWTQVVEEASDRSEGAYIPRPRYLESLPSRWRFVAEHCGLCGTYTFPGRGQCRRCGDATRLAPEALPKNGGTIVARTAIGAGGQPTEFDPLVEANGGYEVVLVEIAPGVRVTLQVTDAAPGELSIGSTVATRLRRLYWMEGEWRYGRKAIPLRSETAAREPAPLEAWRA